MSLEFRVLGRPGEDNALLVQADSGQAVERLLFDCGEGCLAQLAYAEILAIDQLFFSHLHMDHAGGFDTFFRANFARQNKPNVIWGPPETGRILQHRFRGFMWNLHAQMDASWLVNDVGTAEVSRRRFELVEAFEEAHPGGVAPFERLLWQGATATVEVMAMDHQTPSLAYLVRENPRSNIDTGKLELLGLRPGPWLGKLKNLADEDDVEIGGAAYKAGFLREQLTVTRPGASIAYLTDFLLDDAAMEKLAAWLHGCQTVVCESDYRHADIELARRNFHMTSVLAATLAKQAEIGEVVLFHVSRRYQREEWLDLLREAREVFPRSRFPKEWDLEP